MPCIHNVNYIPTNGYNLSVYYNIDVFQYISNNIIADSTPLSYPRVRETLTATSAFPNPCATNGREAPVGGREAVTKRGVFNSLKSFINTTTILLKTNMKGFRERLNNEYMQYTPKIQYRKPCVLSHSCKGSTDGAKGSVGGREATTAENLQAEGGEVPNTPSGAPCQKETPVCTSSPLEYNKPICKQHSMNYIYVISSPINAYNNRFIVSGSKTLYEMKTHVKDLNRNQKEDLFYIAFYIKVAEYKVVLKRIKKIFAGFKDYKNFDSSLQRTNAFGCGRGTVTSGVRRLGRYFGGDVFGSSPHDIDLDIKQEEVYIIHYNTLTSFIKRIVNYINEETKEYDESVLCNAIHTMCKKQPRPAIIPPMLHKFD